MFIHLDRHSSVPLYRQINLQLQKLIVEGTLAAGFHLPPERKLAETLGVNRTTVLNAYRDLKAEGFAAAHVGHGTIVLPPAVEAGVETFIRNSAKLQQTKKANAATQYTEKANGIGSNRGNQAAQPATAPETPVFSFHLPKRAEWEDGSQWRHLFSREAGRTNDTLTRDILALAGRPDMISFAAGIPIPDLEPLPELEQLIQDLLTEKGHRLFHHTPVEGLPALRESIARHVMERSIRATASDIFVLSGAQQGLDLLSRLFLDPGDCVFAEEPTFFCARQLFEGRGATVVGIPCDGEGMRMDALEAWLSRVTPKFIYVMPTFQNPTGRTMSLARRRALLDAAGRHGIPIVEDDAYSGLRYEGCDIPPLMALDAHQSVLYIGSFSKVLFMGLRVGWLQAPRAILRQLAIHRQLSDIHTAAPSQWLVDACLRSGLLKRHRDNAIAESRIRRDLMLDALERHMSVLPGVVWNRPEGGLYVWLILPETLTAQRVATVASRLGVAFVPGHVFSIDGSSSHSLRLNFTYPAKAEIDRGIRILAEAIREAMEGIPDRPFLQPLEDLVPIV